MLVNYDYFVNDLLHENNDLKKSIDFFDEKLKKYEKEHLNKIKKNDEIIQDLKAENLKLRYLYF